VAESQAAAVARRIVDSLRAPFSVAGHDLVVGASIGIATGSGSDPGELLRDADIAMYEAKGAGGATFRFYEREMHETVVKRLQLLADLASASFIDQLAVQYQPIFDLVSGAPVGVEALVRWRHPRRGMLPPSDFIGLAEETGRIADIGAFVLAEACERVAGWGERRGSPLVASVNVSPRQLARPAFASEVAAALGRTGLRADRLALELTESAILP